MSQISRQKFLSAWLQKTFPNQECSLQALTNDASFRRYCRLQVTDKTYVVMDAPPDKEDCVPFIKVAERLRQSGINAPDIIDYDIESGFILLKDFGDQLYLKTLQHDSEMADQLYRDAINTLVQMQTQTDYHDLPLYDTALLRKEMGLFTDWLLTQHLQIFLSKEEKADLEVCFQQLIDNALTQPQLFVHRDYHSRNLMVVDTNNPGVLDFQDAVKGPITYDLVSLLRDCYITWPEMQVQNWITVYLTAINARRELLQGIEPIQFQRWFDWMGIQRHLKASGIFARLYHRDGKADYLADIPRTLQYIIKVSANYPEMQTLHQLVCKAVLPAFYIKQASLL